MTEPRFEDPTALAALVASLPRPLVIGLDVDGVLAPIVAHADDARLSPGIAELLDRLDSVAGVEVAVVSGRSLAGLDQFGFSASLTVIGGHGGEIRGEPSPALDGREQSRYNLLHHLARQAATTAGHGAWVERKPLSVVLHVREVADPHGRDALDRLQAEVARLEGVKATPGSEVLELFARPASKSRAIALLRDHHHPASTVYVGDDVTDEDAFRALGPHDIAIKVGPGPTAATHRLSDPQAVADWLRASADALG